MCSTLNSYCYSCCRASLDRKLVINKAVELVEAIAHKTPELKDRMHYPRVRNNLDNVVPVGSRYIYVCSTPVQASSNMSRHLRLPVTDFLCMRSNLASFRQRRRAKSSGHKQSTDIAQFYLQLKKRCILQWSFHAVSTFSTDKLHCINVPSSFCAGCLLQILWKNVFFQVPWCYSTSSPASTMFLYIIYGLRNMIHTLLLINDSQQWTNGRCW